MSTLTSLKLTAIALSNGLISVFDEHERKLNSINISSELSNKVAYPTCLDISENAEYIAIGTSDAQLIIYSLKTNKKIVKTREHPTALITVKIWKEKPLGLITCDAEGSTQKVIFEHTLGMNRTESYWIFRKTMLITNVLFLNRDMKEYIIYNESGEEEYVAALAGID